MSLALLDSEYQLLEVVKVSPHSQTYLGRDSSGTVVLLRILYQPEQFFDELARYFALDHLDCIPKLLAHYPPPCLDGAEVLNSPELRSVLAFHQNQAIAIPESAAPELDLFHCGVLVTEWIEGPCLASLGSNVPPDQQLVLVNKICNAVEQMHQAGEFHGQLSPEHILLRGSNLDPVFIGLGYYPGKPASPESLSFPKPEAEGHENLGIARDIYALGHYFLRENHRTRDLKLTMQCLHSRIEKRPSIAKVSATLRELNQDVPEKFQSRRTLQKAVAAVVLILGAIFMAFPRYTPPISEEPILTQVGLADLIRAKRPSKPSQLMDEYDLQKPIAVFIFQENVMLIGRNQIYSEGEEVSYRGQTLRISQLTPQSVQLTNGSHRVEVAFDPFDTAASPDASETGVFIWEQPHNLPRLLKAMAAVYKSFPPLPRTQMVCLLDMLARNPEDTIAIRADSIYGSFREKSFDLFVNRLDGLILFEKDQGGYQISLEANKAVL